MLLRPCRLSGCRLRSRRDAAGLRRDRRPQEPRPKGRRCRVAAALSSNPSGRALPVCLRSTCLTFVVRPKRTQHATDFNQLIDSRLHVTGLRCQSHCQFQMTLHFTRGANGIAEESRGLPRRFLSRAFRDVRWNRRGRPTQLIAQTRSDSGRNAARERVNAHGELNGPFPYMQVSKVVHGTQWGYAIRLASPDRRAHVRIDARGACRREASAASLRSECLPPAVSARCREFAPRRRTAGF